MSPKKDETRVCGYIRSEFIHWALWRTLMRTKYFLFVHHTTSILAKLSTWCFEHSGDISCSLLVLYVSVDTYIYIYIYINPNRTSCAQVHEPGGHIVFMITYILCSSCFCEIWALCVSWITCDHLYIYIYNTHVTTIHQHKKTDRKILKIYEANFYSCVIWCCSFKQNGYASMRAKLWLKFVKF